MEIDCHIKLDTSRNIHDFDMLLVRNNPEEANTVKEFVKANSGKFQVYDIPNEIETESIRGDDVFNMLLALQGCCYIAFDSHDRVYWIDNPRKEYMG